MTKNRRVRRHRRLDIASLILALIGLFSGILAYGLIVYADLNPLVFVPSIVTFTVGISHITKIEASRTS